MACYSEALDFKPDWPEAQSNLANSKTFLCDWSARGQELENLQEMHVQEKIREEPLSWPVCNECFGGKPLCLGSVGEDPGSERGSKKKLDFVHSARNRMKKRLGFLSSDFRNHAVGHLIVGVWKT